MYLDIWICNCMYVFKSYDCRGGMFLKVTGEHMDSAKAPVMVTYFAKHEFGKLDPVVEGPYNTVISMNFAYL